MRTLSTGHMFVTQSYFTEAKQDKHLLDTAYIKHQNTLETETRGTITLGHFFKGITQIERKGQLCQLQPNCFSDCDTFAMIEHAHGYIQNEIKVPRKEAEDID